MRRTRLALIGLTVMTACLITPTAAFAAGATGEVKECLAAITEKVEAGTLTSESEISAESTNCYSAPSPILPATNELIWGSLSFIIVAGGLIKFGFPAVKKGLQAREDKIREDLSTAETSKQDAAAKAASYDAKLADARAEATRIIDEAKEQAGHVRADLVAKAEEEAAGIRSKANADAESVASRALSDIHTQVAELSINLAEKVVKNSLDKKAQLELVDAYISDLGKSSKN